MPDYRRYFIPGATYFFTVVTAGRAPLLCEPRARDCLRSAFRNCRERWPFTIDAIALLPDHLHTIWILPPGDADYHRRWAAIKRAFTASWLASGGGEVAVSDGRARQRRRGVFLPRYWEHTIRDETDLERHTDYIHYNPAKHGLCRCPADWPHSSFHRYVREGRYPPDWACGASLRPPPDFTAISSRLGE